MRLFAFALFLCTNLGSQAVITPPRLGAVLVNVDSGAGDRIVFIDTATHAQTSHTLPLYDCSAIGALSANQMLVADDADGGSNLYTVAINNGVPAAPVFRVWVGDRIKRICTLAPGASALLADDCVYTFDSFNNALNVLCPGPIGGTPMDIERTSAGVLLLNDTPAGAYLTEYDLSGDLLAAALYPTIQMAVSLLIVDADTLHVGSANAMGTLYAVTAAPSGGATVSTVSQNHPPAMPTGRSSGDFYRGAPRAVVITTSGSQPNTITIEFDGDLIDFVIFSDY